MPRAQAPTRLAVSGEIPVSHQKGWLLPVMTETPSWRRVIDDTRRRDESSSAISRGNQRACSANAPAPEWTDLAADLPWGMALWVATVLVTFAT